MFSLFRKSNRPAVPPRIVKRRSAPQGESVIPKFPAFPQQEVREPPSVTSNLFNTTLDGQEFTWMGTNRAEFYRYLRDHVPIISAAVMQKLRRKTGATMLTAPLARLRAKL